MTAAFKEAYLKTYYRGIGGCPLMAEERPWRYEFEGPLSGKQTLNA